MRAPSYLNYLLVICFCVGWSFTVRAQPTEAESKSALAQSLSDLEKALKTKEPQLGRSLETAANRFLSSAKNSSDKQRVKNAATELREAIDAEKQQVVARGKTFLRGDKVKAMDRAIADAETFAASVPKTTVSPADSQTQSSGSEVSPGRGDEGGGLLSLIWPIAGGIAAAGLIALAVFGALRLRKGYWAKFDDHVNELVKAHVTGVKRRHDELNKQFSAALNEQQKTSGRLESIEGELQALGRRIRQSPDGGYGGGTVRQAFDDYSRLTPQPIEPEFPASVNEYLDKKRRNSTVVKPDFQNGILVNDIDGKGELVLIRDASVADDAQPLFVVPRVAQFQTKQEFHSYYERYYECQRPSAGDVWIIDPAIVSTVPGGWQLREKGVLEVR
ncbi:MAG TPA: hypothetical protein VFX97_03485 [Pyrinomonadaceae bacterium]|nr:hypothetical protein [Pyrinomonadaceae bacterium]